MQFILCFFLPIVFNDGGNWDITKILKGKWYIIISIKEKVTISGLKTLY